jgi:hypothetical protein
MNYVINILKQQMQSDEVDYNWAIDYGDGALAKDFEKKIDKLRSAIKILSSNERESDRKHEQKENVCPRCKSSEDIRHKPITHDCMECGYTWQT